VTVSGRLDPVGHIAAIGTSVGVDMWLAGRQPGRQHVESTVDIFSPASVLWVAAVCAVVFGFQLAGPLAAVRPQHRVRSSPGFGSSTVRYEFLRSTIVFSSCGAGLLGMRNMTITTTGEDLCAAGPGEGAVAETGHIPVRGAQTPSCRSSPARIGDRQHSRRRAADETVFTYPGVGHLLYQAVSNRTIRVQGILLMTDAGRPGGDFIADSVYVLLDPRTREQGQ